MPALKKKPAKQLPKPTLLKLPDHVDPVEFDRWNLAVANLFYTDPRDIPNELASDLAYLGAKMSKHDRNLLLRVLTEFTK